MQSEVHSATWLTSRRLRAHALILAVALWSVYIWTLSAPGLRDRNGNLKGTDFLHFYTLAWTSREHRGFDLYSIDGQASLASQHVPAATGLRYLPLYPPQVSVFFEPLSRLSYGWALALWWIGSAFLYTICCYRFWRASPNLRHNGGTVFLIATAFPAFFHLIAWGQTSAVALACFTLMYFLLRNKRDFLAGVALGCLIFKPQLAVAAAIVFLVSGAWTVVAGASISAAAQLSIGMFYFGIQPFRTWLRVMWGVRSVLPWLEPRLYQTHCLRTFWSMMIPWDLVSLPIYVVGAILVLAVTIIVWKRPAPLSLRYSALLLATVLVAPHLTVYDLVILAPAMIMLADWLVLERANAIRSRMSIALYFVYVLPLLGPLARWTHVQLSVVAMVALLYMIWRISLEEESAVLHNHRTQAVGTVVCNQGNH